MEYWDIYDRDKKPTGRTMKRNDWCLKDGEYRSDSTWCGSASGSQISDHETSHDKSMGTGMLGGFRWGRAGW